MTTPTVGTGSLNGGKPPVSVSGIGRPTGSSTVLNGVMRGGAPPRQAAGIKGSTGTGGGNWQDDLTGDQRDAYAMLSDLFTGYGLGSLAPKIYDYVKQGYGADVISLLLQDTAEYKARFAGNEARRKAGLAVLTPAQYLATEAAYRQILSSAGLPKGFYDSPSDYTNWIAGDVSPTEIKDRVDKAVAVSNGNPELKQAMKQMYGVSDGDIAAYFLDQSTAAPILAQREQAAEIAAAALARGFAVGSNAERFAAQGITTSQAQQGYGIAQQEFNPLQQIANRFGEQWTQGEAELSVFAQGQAQQPGGEAASDKARRLASQERAMFSGRGGIGSTSLGSSNAGAT